MLSASADAAALLERNDVSVFKMVELILDGGLEYRYTDLPYDVELRGVNWIGAGNLVSLGSLKETEELSAHGAAVILSGIEEASVATALREKYQDRPLNIYLGGIEDDGTYIEPIRLWSGYADNAVPAVDGGAAHILVTAENRMARWAVPNGSTYSDADQKARYPNDRGFEYVADMNEKVTTVVWPSAGFFRK